MSIVAPEYARNHLVAENLRYDALPPFIEAFGYARMTGDTQLVQACIEAADKWLWSRMEGYRVELKWLGPGASVDPVMQRGEHATFFSFGDLGNYRFEP